MKTPKLLLWALFLGLLLPINLVKAAEFPDSKPITIIIPFPKGTVEETGFRILAPALEKALGTKVQVVNKPGWGGQVAFAEFIHMPADGYTLAYLPLPNVIELYHDTSRKPGFEHKDFQPVAQLWQIPVAVTVQANAPYNDFKELLQAIRAKPDSIMVADAGLLTPEHILTGLIERTTGTKVYPVHFTDGVPAATKALLGGNVDAATHSRLDALPLLSAGKVKVLAVSTDTPDPFLPGVPTLKSLGVNVSYGQVTGLVAPVGTPSSAVSVLEEAMASALADPDTVKKLAAAGLVPSYKDHTEFSALWNAYDNTVGPFIDQVAADLAGEAAARRK